MSELDKNTFSTLMKYYVIQNQRVLRSIKSTTSIKRSKDRIDCAKLFFRNFDFFFTFFMHPLIRASNIISFDKYFPRILHIKEIRDEKLNDRIRFITKKIVRYILKAPQIDIKSPKVMRGHESYEESAELREIALRIAEELNSPLKNFQNHRKRKPPNMMT